MTVRKLLYRNVFWRGLFFASQFALNIFVARRLGADLTGHIYYLFTLFSFFTLIAGFSLESAIVYFGSKKEVAFRTLATFSLKWTAGVAAVLLFLSAVFKNISDGQTLYYAFVFICGNVLITFMSAIFYAQKDFLTSNLAAVTVNLLLIPALFLLPEKVFINLYFSSYTFLGLFLAVPVLWKHGKGFVKESGYLPKMFRYAALAFTSNLVFFLLYKIDYWFVNKYTGAHDLGNYIQVSKVAQMFFLVPGVFAQALFPLFASGEVDRVQKRLQFLSRMVFCCYFFLCGAAAIFGKWLFPFVFGPSFGGMYVPFLYLIPGILALSTLYSLTAWFAANNMIGVNLKGSLLATFVIIAGDAMLIPAFGIKAAALVSSAGYIVYHAYVLRRFQRLHSGSYREFFLIKADDFQPIKKMFLKNKV